MKTTQQKTTNQELINDHYVTLVINKPLADQLGRILRQSKDNGNFFTVTDILSEMFDQWENAAKDESVASPEWQAKRYAELIRENKDNPSRMLEIQDFALMYPEIAARYGLN